MSMLAGSPFPAARERRGPRRGRFLLLALTACTSFLCGARLARGEEDWPDLPGSAAIQAAAADFTAAVAEDPETSQRPLWIYWREVYRESGFPSWWKNGHLAQAPDVAKELRVYKWHLPRATGRIKDARVGLLYEVQFVTPEYTRFIETPMGPIGEEGSQELARQTRYGMAYLQHDAARGWWFNLNGPEPLLWRTLAEHEGDLRRFADAGFALGFWEEWAYTLEVLNRQPCDGLSFRIRLSQQGPPEKREVGGKRVTVHVFDRHQNHLKLQDHYLINGEQLARRASGSIRAEGSTAAPQGETSPPERIQLDQNGEAVIEVFLDFARLAHAAGQQVDGVHLPERGRPLELKIEAVYADLGPDGREVLLARGERTLQVEHAALVEDLRVKERSFVGHPGAVVGLSRYDDPVGPRRVLLVDAAHPEGRPLIMGETVAIGDKIRVDARDMHVGGKPVVAPDLEDWHGYVALRPRFLDGIAGELQVNEMYGRTSLLIGPSPEVTGFKPAGAQFIGWVVGEALEEGGKGACKLALGTCGALAVGLYDLYDNPKDAFTVIAVATGIAPKFIRLRSLVALGFNAAGEMAMMTRQGRPVLYTAAAPEGVEVAAGMTAGVKADGTVEISATTEELAQRADEAIDLLRQPPVEPLAAAPSATPADGGSERRWLWPAALAVGLGLILLLIRAARIGGKRS
ncbi:MAG: hypothetical protein HY812_10005 [Planctomycetes bacterium]|nr:hypothetical protein [Planctomycetota bacterium]